MPYVEYHNVAIAGLASAVPSYIQSINQDPEHEEAAYIKSYVKSTGVTQRHIADNGQTGQDQCFAAAQKALTHAGWAADSLDAIINCTQSPDYRCPGNAVLLQYRLGMRTDTIAYDINLGCSAFPFMLFTGGSMMQGTDIGRVLLTFSDSVGYVYQSREELEQEDVFLFGEAGCAVLLEKRDEAAPLKLGMWTDGEGYKVLFNPFNSTRAPYPRPRDAILPNGEVFRYNGMDGVYMDGVEVFTFSTTTAVDGIRSFLERFGTTAEEYDALVLHQANLQIMKTMAKRLKVPMEKVPVTIDRFGNTSSASVPLTITDAFAGSGAKTLRLLCSGFGIGLSWGVADITIDPSVISPVFEDDNVFEEGKIRYKKRK